MLGTRLIAIGLLVSQVFLLTFAVRDVMQRQEMLAGAVHTEAVVVRREEIRRGPGAAGGGEFVTRIMYYRFKTTDGAEVLSRYSSPFNFLVPEEGATLAVAYDPANPEYAVPTSWGRMWFKAGLAGLIHIAMIVLALGMLTRRDDASDVDRQSSRRAVRRRG